MMTEEPFVTTKTIRFKQKQLDKYLDSGVGDFSKFVRMAIDDYDVDFESLKMEAKAEAYNDCITKMTIERDFVLQVLQTTPSVVTQTLQKDSKNQSFVRQSLQDTTKNTQNAIQTEADENPVLQNSLQDEDENTPFVLQMEADPNYEKIEPYLSLLSRQLNVSNGVPDCTKKKISDEENIPRAKVNTFIYEFRNEIMGVPYEIPDEDEKVVSKKYNRTAGEFL